MPCPQKIRTKLVILAILGGSKYAEFNDPLISEAIKRVLMEFKRRAYTSGNMKPEETIIMGEVVEVTTAVSRNYVALNSYSILLHIGQGELESARSPRRQFLS